MKNNKTTFDWRCPEAHDVRSEFNTESLRSDLARDTVEAYCFRCGQSYKFTKAAMLDLRQWLDAQASD